jgi:uncharacterized protein
MDPRLISYLYYFNIEQDYYECHEYGEHLWLETGRPVVLKGLIQAAVCLYHLFRGNVKGGWKMWQKARRYMADGCPIYEQMDLEQLIKDIDAVFAQVPREWYGKMVSSKDVANLHLPTVQIRIVQKDLEQALPMWHPVPLEDD